MKMKERTGIGKVFGAGLKMYLAFLLLFVFLFPGAAQVLAEDWNYYILEDSSSRYISMYDVRDLSVQELCYARNEIYARHGRKFRSTELMEYFSTWDWYDGYIEPGSFQESTLSTIERANVDYLLRREKMLTNQQGYLLDQPGYDITAVFPDWIYDYGWEDADDYGWDYSYDDYGLDEEWYYISSTYSQGIAMHPVPEKDSDILTRLPFGTIFSVDSWANNNYAYTTANGCSGWVNMAYAERIAAPGDYNDWSWEENWYYITSTYSQGIAVHPVPEKESDILGRIPYMEEFFAIARVGKYVYMEYGDLRGWINTDYAELSDTDDWDGWDGDGGYAVTSPGISSDEAWQKLYAFLDRRYGMDTVYKYNGFLNYTGTSGDEYVFWFRSYTGAHIYYYVDMYSGDVWASVENISAGRYEERRYSFNMFDQ